MSSNGADASARAREAEYRFNAANARTTAKRSIENMFSYAEDYSQQAGGSLAQATTLLGKYGYIDKDKYHTRGGTSDLGVTIESTSVESISDTEGMRERMAEITSSLDEYKELYQTYFDEENTKWSGDIDNAGDKELRNRVTSATAARKAAGVLGINVSDLEKEQSTLRTDVEAANETEALIEEQGGIGSVSQISTTSGARRVRGSAYDAMMKAKRTMYRDRAKIIREGVTTSFDSLKAGKHYLQGAEFAKQEASYARTQSALNNFFRVTGSALSIISMRT